MTDAEQPAVPARPRPARWKMTIVISLCVAIQVANLVAGATLSNLAKNHPLTLLLLQPTTKNLLAIAPLMSFGVFFVAGVLRRQVPHPLWFMIGRWYGEAGITWIRKRDPGIASIVESLERWFPRWGWLICLLYPSPVVCVMAGASTMSFAFFLAVTFVGIIFWVLMAWQFGDWLAPVTQPLVNFGGRYWIPITIVSTLLVVFTLWNGERTGKSKIESVHRIEEELEAEERRKLDPDD